MEKETEIKKDGNTTAKKKATKKTATKKTTTKKTATKPATTKTVSNRTTKTESSKTSNKPVKSKTSAKTTEKAKNETKNVATSAKKNKEVEMLKSKANTKESVKKDAEKKVKKNIKNDVEEEIEEVAEENQKEKKALTNIDFSNTEILEKIKNERKSKQKLTQNKKDNIILHVSKNAVIATAVMAYFIYISIGATCLEPLMVISGLKVLSLIMILFTILVFEVGYKKDSGMLAIHGIETLIMSICTLLLILAYQKYQDRFVGISNSIGILFCIYYFAKCIVIELKAKKKAKLENIEKEANIE